MGITFASQHRDPRGILRHGPEVDVNNDSGIHLLWLLGYVPDSAETETFLGCPILPAAAASGCADPESFLGRVLVAIGLLDAATAGTGAFSGPGGISGGRLRDHLAASLVKLEHVARDAHARDARVTWD